MGGNIFGAEGIVIHGDKIVLGMQKPKRWYNLENGEKAAIIKTLGGAVKDIDLENTRKTLIREILEEVQGTEEKDINVSHNPIFSKEANLRALNPYEQDSNLKMRADFYVVEISKDIQLMPNDLPALIEIPIDEFVKIELSINFPLYNIKNYVIKKESEIAIPENCAIMAPKEIKNYLKTIKPN